MEKNTVSKMLSDEDLLNILQSDQNASPKNESKKVEHENQTVNLTNEIEDNVLLTPRKDFLEGDGNIEDREMEKLDMSKSPEDFNENAEAYLSLNVNDAELDILNDSNEEDGNVEDENLEDENLETEIDNTGDDVASDQGNDSKEPLSELHCVICSNYFYCPKLLECFHTFCQPCLTKRIKSSHKFIFCPLCRNRMNIPKGGIAKLTDNVVVANLISTRSEEQHFSECMICKLHGEVRASAGQCIDCGDTMCEDCCNKHTFSRLTAKHNVVSLEEMKNQEYLKLGQTTRVISCNQHSESVAEYFCSNCCIPVCKDCTMSDHRIHHCELLSDAIAGKKELIQEKLDSFKQECDKKLVDDTEDSETLISEHEKKEFEKLKQVKDALISIIEQKYYKCAEKLQQEYDIKRRKYCKHKKQFIQSCQKTAAQLTKGIDFMLQNGNEIDHAMMETFITNMLDDKRMQLSKIRPKVTIHSNFPKVHVFKEHMKVVEGLTLFTSESELREQKNKDHEEKKLHSAMHVENAEVRMKIGRTFQTELNSAIPALLETQPQPMMSAMMSEVRTQVTGKFQSGMNTVSPTRSDQQTPSLLSLNLSNLRAPIGRGMTFRTGSETRPSLLGEYTGQSMLALQDALSDNASQSAGKSKNRRRHHKKKGQTSAGKSQAYRLNLRNSLNIKVILDLKTPDIVDLVFMSDKNFAVTDARNHRLKLFSVCGKFIKYIDDPGPMSVTFCANHLVWSSQFSSIKLFDIQAQRIVRIERVPQVATHPLTSFNNVKYLIGNMDRSKVHACNIDGHHAHVIQPYDRNGPLPDVTHIAARSADQLVCVDGLLKKVVVNDFDGKFVGEYSCDGFEPGGVCITEHDNIFVTDRKRNKLILLNAKAEIIHEWNTLIDSPSCVASNGNKNIIVAGNGQTVSLYEYSLE